jgi:hypothetical protein
VLRPARLVGSRREPAGRHRYGSSSTVYDQGNSVPRLTADLRQVAVFAPGDWAALSRSGTDLYGYGGVGGQRFSGHVCGVAFGATAATIG